MNYPETIPCRECKQDLPLTEFYQRKEGGVSSRRCKECTKRLKREKYQSDPEFRAAHMVKAREYYLEHDGKNRQRRRDPPTTQAERMRAWRKSEKGRASLKKWNDLRREKQNEWRRNSESYKAKAKARRETEEGRAKSKAACAKRRARMKIVSTLTAAEWREIQARYKHKCVYCGAADLPLTQDHVIPLRLGGPHTKENVVPACGPCNSRKGAKTGLGL